MKSLSFALSLTGSGHLLVYQLGVSRILLRENVSLPFVVGASGGAIVATIVSHMPHRLETYAERFIHHRGGGLQLLRELYDYQPTSSRLHIAVTRCNDGSSKVFEISRRTNPRHFFAILQASCRIPPTFHPVDILSRSPSPYPSAHGVAIDQEHYVDGGIATPAPPTPNVAGSNLERLVVSPVSGVSDQSLRISPADSSWRIWSKTLPIDFGIHYSLQNLRSLKAAVGMTTSSELRDWYERGQDDARGFVKHC